MQAQPVISVQLRSFITTNLTQGCFGANYQGMQIGLRQFSADTVEWLRQAVSADGASRSGLAAELCEREGWHNAGGDPCVSSARKVLPLLAAKLGLSLPARQRQAPARGPLPAFPDVSLEAELKDLGEVSLEPVSDRVSARRFRAMMASHHPEGVPHHPGKRLSYFVVSQRFGCLGGIGFCAASWHQAARDAFIGWSGRARVAHLGLVLNNSRFLVLPSVRVSGLASHVLGQAASRVAADWASTHGEHPVLAYSYVGLRHKGTSYLAAGWTHAGETSGRPPGREEAGGARAVWMKPLCAEWRGTLCAEPAAVTGSLGQLHLDPAADWAAREFGRGSHPDGRLRRRIEAMGRYWEARRGAPLPVIFPGRAEREAAYRLLSSPTVAMDDILESHRETSAERCNAVGVALLIQDTTLLTYNTRRFSTGGLASIGGEGRMGIPVHATLAVSDGGRPLGVLDLEGNFRPAQTTKTSRKRRKDPSEAGGTDMEPAAQAAGAARSPEEEEEEEKESIRWQRSFERACELGRACGGTRVISLSDRDGDIRGLFAAQAAAPEAAGLLMRARRSKQRRVLVNGKGVALFAHMDRVEPCARRTLELTARGGEQAGRTRTATLEFRIARVDLMAAAGKQPGPLPLTAVLITEPDPPRKSRQPLRWLLLSSEGDATAEWAVRICRWYETRRSIEEYFRALKTGTCIEDRRLDDADGLRKSLVFDAITAWRVFELERAGG